MLIEELCSDCRIFEPDSDLRDDFEISETQLINGLREIFLQNTFEVGGDHFRKLHSQTFFLAMLNARSYRNLLFYN